MLYCFKTENHGWIVNIDDGVHTSSQIKIFEYTEEEAEEYTEKCAKFSNEKVTLYEVNLKKIATYDCCVSFNSIDIHSKFYWNGVLFIKVGNSTGIVLQSKNNMSLGAVITFYDSDFVKKYV